MLGILKVKMSLEYPTFETAFESGLRTCDNRMPKEIPLHYSEVHAATRNYTPIDPGQ